MRTGKNYQLGAEVDDLKKRLKESSPEEKEAVSKQLKAKKAELRKAENRYLLAEINRHKYIYLLLFIPVVYYFIFKYIPLWNGQIAFRDFISLKKTGITGGKWVGLKNFKDFISSYYFWSLIRNTLMYSFGKLLVSLPLSILLAIAIYECTHKALRKVVQTLSYLPHFLSWAFVASFLNTFLSDRGTLNPLLISLGILNEPFGFLSNKWSFVLVIIVSSVWKSFGYSSIIYLAAMTSVPQEMYEAALIDGATRFQKIWYITLPHIKPTFIILLLYALGSIMKGQFELFYQLIGNNGVLFNITDIFDTYVYRITMTQPLSIGLGTAAG
ncbi:MAG: sugar ABC transporter permease, partial [Spirochaetales bacterium]|nr:sugar ABC transporter permease [Spirochaetales bacterium]